MNLFHINLVLNFPHFNNSEQFRVFFVRINILLQIKSLERSIFNFGFPMSLDYLTSATALSDYHEQSFFKSSILSLFFFIFIFSI